MEIGSFIELQFLKGKEYYSGELDIARLNTGRVAIWHAFRCTGAKKIWLPYYQCDTVRDFLLRKNVDILYYHIDKHFNPVDLCPKEDDAVLLVNYYGIMSRERMQILSQPYSHSIIDNCQAFFCQPLDCVMNVYSTRKFMGVPDGSYVIGKNAHLLLNEYAQSFSSDTASFLLKRIEYGCEGISYEARSVNESRIDNEDAMRMSKLTHAILDGTDYELIREKRKRNFQIACDLFGGINMIDPLFYYDNDTVPMIYPLLVEDDELINRLLNAKHFQGRWWSYLLEEMEPESVESWISRYIVPITIDQRYGREHLEYLKRVICK